ncbi:MAG: hypothetical protein ACUVRK_05100 [Spirochaetota bacterium]
MQNIIKFLLLYLFLLIGCSDMLQDVALMGGKDFMTEIYVGIYTGNTIIILNEKGSIKDEINSPVTLNQFAVNPYREVLTVENDATNDFLYITRPRESKRHVGMFPNDFLNANCNIQKTFAL